MNPQALNILMDTACLSKRQLEQYASCKTPAEECHSVEMHLITCPYCNAAVEGIDKKEDRITVLKTLDNGFIDHFFNKQYRVVSVTQNGRKTVSIKKKASYTLQVTAVAASVLLLAGIIWFFDSNKQSKAEPAKITTVSDGSIYAEPVKERETDKTNVVR